MKKRYVALMICGGLIVIDQTNRHLQETAASAAAALSPSAETPAEIHARQMVQDTRLVDGVRDHINQSRDRLKHYYATADEVQQAAGELTDLTAVAVNHAQGDGKERVLAQKARALIPSLAQQTRLLYASALEERYVKNGFDIAVRVNGTELLLTYALMSKPLVYKLQNESSLTGQAANYGFTRIVYTNGFESSLGMTWTQTLSAPW